MSSWRTIFKNTYKSILPDPLLVKIDQRVNKRNYGQALHALSIHYEQEGTADIQNEFAPLYAFIRQHGFSVFPYPFCREYLTVPVALRFDKTEQLPYIDHNGRKLYFPASMHKYDIRRLYRSLIAEQDLRSPHAYSNPNFPVSSDARILDLGAAEGIWTLNNIEKIERAVLVEADPAWSKALRATFRPYMDKITLIEKFVGAQADQNTITIPELVEQFGPFTNVKMDIEGMELGIVKTMRTWDATLFKNTYYAICTYHRQDDAANITEALPAGMSYRFSDGYTFFFYDADQKKPFFRKTLLFLSPQPE